MKVLLSVFFATLICTGWCHDNDIPDHGDVVKMARYIMHNTDWVSIATVSTMDKIKGYPFNNLKSVSDGSKDKSTGMPYLLMTDMDMSGTDVLSDNRVSIMATLAETTYCHDMSYDPQDPRCGRLLISGRLQKVKPNTDEYKFARDTLFERHPAMKLWVIVHKFYVAKMDIEQIVLLDYFGGAKVINPEDYFKANATWDKENDVSVRQYRPTRLHRKNLYV